MERPRLGLSPEIKKALANPFFLRLALALFFLTTPVSANKDSHNLQDDPHPQTALTYPISEDFHLLIQEYKIYRSSTRLSSAKQLEAPKKHFTAWDTLKALENASPLVKCAVTVEVGGTNPPYDPNAIGKAGELGPGQLHPKGKLPAFYNAGYNDPFNPYQVIPFMEEQFVLGDAKHWAGPRNGEC